MSRPVELSRRRFLGRAGAGLLGSAVAAAAPVAAAPPRTFGKARAIVVLYLYGAPSQMDTLDPKPDAPQERRGLFGTIPTRLPGVRVCEHLPRLAGVLDRVCLVRSMSHASNNHAVSVALSGLSRSEPSIEANRADPQHWPYFGSVLEYLWRQGGAATELPQNLILPWPLNARTDPNRWSPHAAWLGPACNPVYPLFRGEGALEVGQPTANGATPLRSHFDPYDGVTPSSTFALDGAELPGDVSAVRFADRLQLLGGLEKSQSSERQVSFARLRRSAVGLITDPRVARAADVTREPLAVREKYGLTLFGMEALAARRLIEAGVRVVTAFWDDYAYPNNAWDTHHNHFPRLKDGLCPVLDRVVPAFLDDMEQRGLLDETLVLVISEHGRTPVISNTSGGGREHWSGAYWGMFFGAGIRTGQVIGATDRQGGYPTTRAIDPKDILATAYHLLGFDPAATTIPDRLGRPMHLMPHGAVVGDMLI
jgi:uncharacterized protein (DUF1501 family)